MDHPASRRFKAKSPFTRRLETPCSPSNPNGSERCNRNYFHRHSSTSIGTPQVLSPDRSPAAHYNNPNNPNNHYNNPNNSRISVISHASSAHDDFASNFLAQTNSQLLSEGRMDLDVKRKLKLHAKVRERRESLQALQGLHGDGVVLGDGYGSNMLFVPEDGESVNGEELDDDADAVTEPGSWHGTANRVPHLKPLKLKTHRAKVAMGRA